MLSNLLTIKSISRTQIRPDLIPELLLRLFMVIASKITDDAVPWRRIIRPDQVWQYNFPHTEDIVSSNSLHVFNLVMSLAVIWAIYRYNRNIDESINALLGVTLSIFLTITITNVIKITAGRPRPDFFARCYMDPPKYAYNLSLADCDMPEDIVNQGYKSFPSGHSAMAFGCMAYISFYIAWSLRVFQHMLQYPGLRLIAFIVPLVCATLIAVSRTIDYHHHWQDVLFGSLIGTTVAYMCFCQGFPNLLGKKLPSNHPSSPQSESSFLDAQNY